MWLQEVSAPLFPKKQDLYIFGGLELLDHSKLLIESKRLKEEFFKYPLERALE
jgi:hypothetical protein